MMIIELLPSLNKSLKTGHFYSTQKHITDGSILRFNLLINFIMRGKTMGRAEHGNKPINNFSAEKKVNEQKVSEKLSTLSCLSSFVNRKFEKSECEKLCHCCCCFKGSIVPGKTKYRTGKDHYRWSRRKSRSFLKTHKYFFVLINKLDFHGTNGSPSLPISIQYSLAFQKGYCRTKNAVEKRLSFFPSVK